MVLVNSFEGEGVANVFNQVMREVRWSRGLSDEVKRVLILEQINEIYCTRRFYCTEMYNLSIDQRKLNQFGKELDNNRSLVENRGYIRELFSKYVSSQDFVDSLLPLGPPPRLRRSVVLSVIRDTDDNYKLYRNGKAIGFNITVPVNRFEDISRDF